MFDLEHIARITGGELSGSVADGTISGLSTDSRNISAGDLFVPLRGENFDGHDYIGQAVQKGAAACLSEEVIAGLSVPVVRVANTLDALGNIASAWRQQLHGPLIGVTGSAGKTTTKEMLAGILERIGPGLKTAGNFNNLIGLPLTLLRLEERHQWAVIEMGTSALGEIERLTEIARPDVGVVTNIGAAHLESLPGLDGVARAKGELLAGLKGGIAAINADDPRVVVLPVANGVKRVTYGLSAEAQVRGEAIVSRGNSVSFDLCVADLRRPITLKLPGRHNVLNALAAATVALELDVSMENVVAGLEAFNAVSGRMCLTPTGGGGMVLDDSYNSNPLSAAAALEALQSLGGSGRRIAVMGDMLELGFEAPDMHEELGQRAAAVADVVIAVGFFADQIATGAQQAGMDSAQIYRCADADEAIRKLVKIQCREDQILIKGSRAVRLDRVAAALTAKSADHSAGQEC